ncbi:protein of unknown function [Methylacidimicrobium sp. AP8]|nr:protein of unknown function [Methylacidimicrobium sp. AP8]
MHRLREMLAQRVFGIALGYEDLNDHEQLRTDPLVALLSGKRSYGSSYPRSRRRAWMPGPIRVPRGAVSR